MEPLLTRQVPRINTGLSTKEQQRVADFNKPALLVGWRNVPLVEASPGPVTALCAVKVGDRIRGIRGLSIDPW
jgi:hypothetical protein